MLIKILILFVTLPVVAETPDPYIEALSNEANKTKMKPSSVATTDNEPEPDVVLEGSVDELAEKISDQLEIILTGKTSKKIKKKQLAEVISSGVKEGRKIDEIHDIVRQAMTELKGKEGLDIQPELAEYAEKVVTDIVTSSKNLARGDQNDPYIQALNAEVSETTLDGNSNSPEEKQSHRQQTIVVLKGDSLYKIAKKIYGSGDKYMLLFNANRDQLKDPNLIETGQILNIPF
jgi:nucleoid-associated protein YgaU